MYGARRFADLRNADLLAAQMRAEQVDMVARLTPAMMLGNLSNLVVALVAIYPTGQRLAGLVWAVGLAVMTLLLFWRRIVRRQEPRPRTASPAALRMVVRNGFLIGVLWGCLPALFYADNSVSGQILIICLAAGMLATGALALASIPAASVAFMAPLLLASVATLLWDGQPHSYLVAALAMGFSLLLLYAVAALHERFVTKAVSEATAEQAAMRDSLTGLLNRAGFEEYVEVNAIRPMKRHGAGFGLLYLDLDSFKLVNDTLGHPAGDELLKQVAERLRHSSRSEDCVARLGGDEFGIVVRDVADVDRLAAVAERIVRGFQAPFYVEGRPIACRTSIGIARAPMEGDDVATIIKSADIALYLAKKQAPGTYAFLEKSVDERLRRRKHIGLALSKAIAAGELSLEFQPIYSAAHGRVTAFESLLRWTNPELGAIGPGEFVPVAEELGLIQDIGEWVIRRTCEVLAQMPEHIRIGVNFSPLQLKSPTLVQFTLNALAEHGVDPRRFEIEITETISIEGDEQARNMLATFRDHGVTVALDDFGTGYSSLSYICSLPLDRVKIDRSFVASLSRNPQSIAVIQAILGLARSLGLQVVAEGIETRLQYDVIAGHGCEEFQGYLLARPLSVDAALEVAHSNTSALRLVA